MLIVVLFCEQADMEGAGAGLGRGWEQTWVMSCSLGAIPKLVAARDQHGAGEEAELHVNAAADQVGHKESTAETTETTRGRRSGAG